MSAPIAIILAAGKGERFGGPKVLAPWVHLGFEGPLGVAHLQARRDDCSRALLVVRAAFAAALRAYPLPPGAELVCSSEPDEDGPAGSIAAAVAYVAPTANSWLLLSPVDVPPASTATVRALRDAVNGRDDARASRPVHGGRGGHPVLVRAGVLVDAYRDGRPPLRQVLRGLGGAFLDVPVEDPDVTLDFDYREALLSHLEKGGGPSRA